MTLNETIQWLSIKSIEEKILFNELLLSEMTVMNRAIWDDLDATDKMKIESLKWSNELAHRIWNILFELKRGVDEHSVNAVADTINFYRKQSDTLSGHLGTTLLRTIERFNFFIEK